MTSFILIVLILGAFFCVSGLSQKVKESKRDWRSEPGPAWDAVGFGALFCLIGLLMVAKGLIGYSEKKFVQARMGYVPPLHYMASGFLAVTLGGLTAYRGFKKK